MNAYVVTFDNSGTITVFAESEKSAMEAAEQKAQDQGWNLRARNVRLARSHKSEYKKATGHGNAHLCDLNTD